MGFSVLIGGIGGDVLWWVVQALWVYMMGVWIGGLLV